MDLPRMHMQASWIAMLCLMLALAFGRVNDANAFVALDVFKEEPPKRLALVVGNSDYKTVASLPGSIVDADEVARVLAGLGFDVKVAKDVRSRGEFFEDYFYPFLDRISEGDVVVFYFSGHGFTYAGENYLTTLNVPLVVEAAKVFTTFLSSTRLHDEINARDPALTIMFLDACRTLKGFQVALADGRSAMVPKGLTEVRAPAGNSVIGFSSDIGAESFGSSNPSLSVYTEALVKALPVPGQDFDYAKKVVRREVIISTDNKQVPWFSESSSAVFYMQPTSAILAEMRKAWENTLQEGTRREVRRYLMTYGTGPWGARARDWLRSNPNAPEDRPSTVWPIAAEAVWEVNGARTVVSFDGAIRPQSAVTSADVAAVEDLRALQRARRYETLGGDWDGKFGAELLTSAREAVVAHAIEARSAPNVYASTVADFRPGQKLIVQGSTVDGNDNVWLSGRTPASDQTVYVPFARAYEKITGIAIGTPAMELKIKPRASGLGSLVDESEITAAVNRLKGRGKTLSWASIATPSGPDEREANLNALRANHLRAILVRAGLSRDHITTVEDTPLDQPGIRLRLFTN
jgi:hypothetical protein